MESLPEGLAALASSAITSIISRQTNESQSDIARAFNAAIPSVAAATARRCDDSDFMSHLASLASGSSISWDIPKGIQRIISLDTVDTTTPSGSFLANLFGNNLSDFVERIASYAGIQKSSAAKVIAMSGPMVLGYLGRLIRSESLTANGLADRIRQERSHLAAAVPVGFDVPEFATGGVAPAYASSSVRATSRRAMSRASIAVPLAALAALLGVGALIWWTGGSRPAVREQARVESNRAIDKAVGTSGMTARALDSVNIVPGEVTKALPGNVIIKIRSGSAEDRLANYLASGTPTRILIGFDRVNFASGSAVLSPEARDQIDQIATILRAYPNTSVVVTGYTDKKGQEAANVALSRMRAEMIGSRLTVDGVAANRVRTEGRGSENPLADNDTDAGRAQNRRVELQIDAK